MPLLPHFLQSHAIACAQEDPDSWHGWHQGRQRYAVWALEIGALDPQARAAVQAACAQARAGLAHALAAPGQRQLHVTLATAGFLDGDAALPDAYGAQALARDLQALAGLPAAALRLEFGGWGSFEMAPYLAVRDQEPCRLTLARLHGALASRAPVLALTEPLRPYVPHVTLGAWRAAWPREQVLQWMRGLPALQPWQAALGEIALVSYAAGALCGPLAVHARYDLVGRRLRWLAPPAWAQGQGPASGIRPA